jgi:hypothetical protein
LTTASLCLAVRCEVPLQDPLTMHGASLQEGVAQSRALMPHLSWMWGCSTWLGLLALFGKDHPLRWRRVAWSALCVAVVCGLCVNMMRVGIAVGTQAPW